MCAPLASHPKMPLAAPLLLQNSSTVVPALHAKQAAVAALQQAPFGPAAREGAKGALSSLAGIRFHAFQPAAAMSSETTAMTTAVPAEAPFHEVLRPVVP
mmetsp:Transcript_121795/g.389433  ORF Transcript_121795/g.389433 Transcript_121795/m.389433 type:complete len:100 (-) Transcript_121795:591-890(-)